MSETLAQKIRFYHAVNPDWSSAMIARVVGCSSEYVRSAVYRSGGHFGGKDTIGQRNTACRRAFHDPAGRTIATKDIGKALFWDIYDVLSAVEKHFRNANELKGVAFSEEGHAVGRRLQALFASLKIQEPENG